MTPSARPGSGCSPAPSGTPMSWNSPSVKFGPTWQVRHWPAADEDLEPAPRGLGQGGQARLVAGAQALGEDVEGRVAADDAALVRGEGLAHGHEHPVHGRAVPFAWGKAPKTAS